MNLLARNITNRFNQCEIIVDKLNNGIRNLNQVGIKLILLSFFYSLTIKDWEMVC